MDIDIDATFASIRDSDPDVLDTDGLDAMQRRIAALRAWCDARQVRVTRRQRQLAAEGRAADPRQALARHGRASSREARAASERERVCSTVSGFEDALERGELTAGHVDAVAAATGQLDEAAAAEFNSCADDLLADAQRSGVDEFGRNCRDLAASIRARHDARADVDELERQREQSKVSRWVDRDTGMHKTLIEADPETDRRIWSAVQRERGRLRQRQRREGSGRGATWDRLTVDALVAAVSADTTDRPARPAGRDGIVVHVDVDTLADGRHDATTCELDTGFDVPVDTMRRIACEADIIPVVLSGRGVALDQGRARRLATPEQRLAVQAMHATCAHPDCSVSIDDCRVHHIDPWSRGGRTDLDRMAPLCETHHHLVHEGGWTFTMTADRIGTWIRPDGETYWSGAVVDRRPRRTRDVLAAAR